ncbi:hypothetical protein [Hirschia litorea]|uniref:Uncharacterized protein n=1 Tax=Hirschia litorea TaxID=1199156 RepID=A0ABW2IPC2_9PROT
MTVYQFEPHRKRRDEQAKQAAKQNAAPKKNTIKYIGLLIGIVVLVAGIMYGPGSL